MSRRKNPDSIPTVSFACSLYSVSSVLFLAVGFARGELVSSLCGALLACYLAFCLAFALLARYLSARASVSLSWTDAHTVIAKLSRRRNGAVPFRMSFPFPGAFADATLIARYEIVPETAFAEPFVVSIPLRAEESRCVVTHPPRGRYEPEALTLVVSDVSGFFSFSRSLGDARIAPPFAVYPRPEQSPFGPSRPSVAGRTPGKSAYRKSDDLYDSRPYAPGDDPRAINWNLYAHTGVPFVREGESLPPPADEYVLSFLTRYPGKPSDPKRVKAEFDALVDRAATIALSLSRERKTLAFPAASRAGACETIVVAGDAPDADARILDALSRVQPGHPPCRVAREPLPPSVGATELVFMTADVDPAGISELRPSGNLEIVVGPWDAAAPNAGRIEGLCASLAKGGFNVSKA